MSQISHFAQIWYVYVSVSFCGVIVLKNNTITGFLYTLIGLLYSILLQ